MPESGKNLVLNDFERKQVQDALEAILATEKFDAAPQMSAFLRYVVEQTANGMQSRIKAFTVAVDALGKPDTFDPQNDPVVRVLAGRLRAALAAYNAENPDAGIVIKMVPGSYVPIFECQHHIDSLASSTVMPLASEQSGKRAPHNFESMQTPVTDTLPHTVGANRDNSPESLRNRSTSDTSISDVNPTTFSSTHDARLSNDKGVHNTQPNSSSFPGKLIKDMFSTPMTVIAGVLVAGWLLTIAIQNRTDAPAEPAIRAAIPESAKTTPLSGRLQPKLPSVFVSAVDEGNKLENSLNALVSGVISENEQFQVFRILDRNSEIRFWPNEYIMSITALDLPDETRVNLQLIEAISGQLIQTESVSLNEDASSQLMHEEVKKLTDATRRIVAGQSKALEKAD